MEFVEVNDVPAKDIYHGSAKTALIKDGWTITHDPLTLPFGRRPNVYVDLGARRLIAASKGKQKIAVEIKSFLGKSEAEDLEAAWGQYALYLSLLEEKEPDRKLFLAVTQETYDSIFNEPVGQRLIEKLNLNIVIFDEQMEAGVPKDKIVLAFYSPRKRVHTEFAVS